MAPFSLKQIVVESGTFGLWSVPFHHMFPNREKDSEGSLSWAYQ